jgi:CubicO group peptidase (beta-lactamase class C family)
MPRLRILLLTLIAPTVVAAQDVAHPREDSVDVTVSRLMASQNVPGAAVAIVQDGRIVKVRGYGFADVEHAVPVGPATIFQSGSLGKQFTAAAVLLLAEDGLLDVDDPITEHLTDVPAEWQDITIRHLLTHTSGLGAYEPRVNFRDDYTDEELLGEIAAADRSFEPGEAWKYSNSGYVVLGILINRLTGEHWGKFLRTRVFLPAGMGTARVISEADVVRNRASGYHLVDGELKNQEWVSPTFLQTGDGALYFSVLDLVAWEQALRDGLVLSAESVDAMWTRATLNSGRAVGYGFGWEISGPPAVPHVAHGGAWQGFRSYLVRYEDPAITVILLANSAEVDATAWAYAIASAHSSALADPVADPIVLPETELRAFVGTYRDDAGLTIEFTVEGETLRVLLSGMPFEWHPVGNDTFIRPGTMQRLTFVRDDAGHVVEGWLGRVGTPLTWLTRVDEAKREK